MQKPAYVLLSIVLPALVTVHSTQAQFRYDVVAVTGDAVPNGNGAFTTFSVPTLNEVGQVAFSNVLSDPNSSNDIASVYRGDSTGNLVELARSGDAAPDGNGIFSSFGFPSLNDSGQSAFRTGLTGTVGASSDDTGIFRSDGTGNVVQIFREGDAAPDGNGTLSNIGSDSDLSNAGDALFSGLLNGTSGGNTDRFGIFRSDGTSSPVRIARAGDAAPDGNGTFSGFSQPRLNNAGKATFIGFLANTSNGGDDDTGFFIGDGIGGPSQIVRGGEEAPDGNGTFAAFSRTHDLNDGGQIAFVGFFSGTSAGTGDDEGIFVGDDSTSPIQIARAGQSVPNGNGVFTGFGPPRLNDNGQTVFFGEFTTTTASRGVFRGDGTNALVEIALSDEAAPDGNGVFFGFGTPDVNSAGQIAFVGTHIQTNEGSSDDRGLYFYDDLVGLKQVVREGDAFLGSTITRIGYPGPVGRRLDMRSALNDLGQLAYQFELADGRQGIAIATLVPEPSTLLLGLLASGTWLFRKRS